MPEDEAGAGDLLNAEQVKLLAQQAMVALGCFFQVREMGVQILLREKGRAVDPLQLRILLVAEPVCARQRQHLEGLHAAGRRHMRAAAKVDEVAVAIEAYLRPRFRELGHKVGLHEVAVTLELFESSLTRLVDPRELLVARDDFLHLGLDGGQVLRCEVGWPIEVVEETCVRGGAVAQLGLREQFEDGSRHHMCCRMPDNPKCLRGLLIKQLQAGIRGEWSGEGNKARSGGIFGGIHGGFGRPTLGGGGLAGSYADRGEAGDDG